MFYSDDLIEEVRSRNDVVDVIGGYTSLKKQGSSYVGLCPFHNEKTPSFRVSREKQMYKCFGCGVGGNVITFVMEYENFSFPEAVKHLAERASIELPQYEMTEEAKRKADYKMALKEMNKVAAGYFYYLLKSEKGKKAYEYLTNRGITEETIKMFGLGYSDIYRDDLYKYLKSKGYTDKMLINSGLVTIDEKNGGTDKFWNRVMYPIMDINSKVIGFGGRVMGEGEPKYLNSKETEVFDKSRNLYGLNLARVSKRNGIILCEGYMDVISMHQAGVSNACASLGTAFTIGQATLLKRYTDKVFLAYDSDGAGVKAALRAIPILNDVGISARVINMRPHKDPDEFIKNLGLEAFEERINNAVSSIMFEAKVISEKYNVNDPAEKTNFQHNIARRLSDIEDPLERKNYVEAVANEYFIDKKLLNDLVTEYGINRPVKKDEYKEKEGYSDKAAKKEDLKNQPQKLLLTWYVNETNLFSVLKNVISPKDFIEPLYNKVAQMLFNQYRDSGKVTPAAIINQFTDIDEQKKVANLFQTDFQMEINPDDTDKALTDIVKKVKTDSILYEINHSTDQKRWQELFKEKEETARLHISLKDG